MPVKRYGQLGSEEEKKIRPVKAVIMRWMIEGKTLDTILSMTPGSLTIAEFVAWQYLENAHKANAGTNPGVRASEALRLILDGPEDAIDPGKQMTSLVTLIDRLTLTDRGQAPVAQAEVVEEIYDNAAEKLLQEGTPEEETDGKREE